MVVDGQTITIRTLPALIEPQIEAMPMPVPESAATNPCDSCFAYMTSLIDQLAGIGNIEAHPRPELEVLPEPEVELEILPHPMPTVEVVPEEEREPENVILPHPIPIVQVIPDSWKRN